MGYMFGGRVSLFRLSVLDKPGKAALPGSEFRGRTVGEVGSVACLWSGPARGTGYSANSIYAALARGEGRLRQAHVRTDSPAIENGDASMAKPTGTITVTWVWTVFVTLAVLLSSCGGQAPYQEEFPEFPWPPPEASATEVLPRELLDVVVGRHTLGDIDTRITAALDSTGYFENSYFAVPDGFALVTQLEQIESTGASVEGPERWSLEVVTGRFSLAEYLDRLVFGVPGYYRVIVFVVTSRPFSQSNAQITVDLVRSWRTRGFNLLPGEVAGLDYTDDVATTVLVYEFARPTENDPPRFTNPGSLSSRVHLERSGIWRGFQS